jgi:cell volume regulation protein A
MEVLDSISLIIFIGAILVLAGIMSSLVAMRFGAPLLLVFLLIGMLAGEAGPGGIRFDDVALVYAVGSVALALIIFDGGLRTRFAIFRSVLLPSSLLASIGVVITAALTAPAAVYALGLSWTEGLLVGAIIGSTDAAAVFFLLHAKGVHLRPRVAATIEIESATNDPAAILMTLVLVEILLIGQKPWTDTIALLIWQAAVGGTVGLLGGLAILYLVNRVSLAQGLYAPLVAAGALAIFGLCQTIQASGFVAVYLAGLLIGNRPMRNHNSTIAFLDAATWLGQIVMFVLLGLLAWPKTLVTHIVPALAVAFMLTFVARPVAVFLCTWPFEFNVREKVFISWVGLRGSVSVFLASIPLLVALPNAQTYFDVGFVVVLISLLVQGWTIAPSARWLGVARTRLDPFKARVELELPGQRAQELVGYPVVQSSAYLRGRLAPRWAKLALVVRNEQVLTPEEAGPVHEGDHVYFLAPQEKAPSLDRLFADAPPAAADAALIEDFFLPGDTHLGALAEIYGLTVPPEKAAATLSDCFAEHFKRPPRTGDVLRFDPVALVAHTVVDGKVVTVGLQLDEPEPVVRTPWQRIRQGLRRPGRILRVWLRRRR